MDRIQLRFQYNSDQYHRKHPRESLRICGQWQIRHRMDYGTLPNHHPQRKRHPQQPQRLGSRSRQPTLYIRFVAEHH